VQFVRGLFYEIRIKHLSKSRLAAFGAPGFSLSIISFFLLDERAYYLTRVTFGLWLQI